MRPGRPGVVALPGRATSGPRPDPGPAGHVWSYTSGRPGGGRAAGAGRTGGGGLAGAPRPRRQATGSDRSASWPSKECSMTDDGLYRSAILAPEEDRPAWSLGEWLVSARRSDAQLRLIDCSPVAKLIVQAPPAGVVAEQLAVPVGRAELFEDGLLAAVHRSRRMAGAVPDGPGTLPGRAARLGRRRGHRRPRRDPGSHGRAPHRARAGDLLGELCQLDLGDRAFPPGSVTYAPVVRRADRHPARRSLRRRGRLAHA